MQGVFVHNICFGLESGGHKGLSRRHRLGPKGPLRKRSSRSQLLRYPGNGKAPPFREATTGNASALRRLPFRGDCFSFAVFFKKMFSWNPCKTLLEKIVTVNRKLTTVYVRLPWSAACLLFVWQPCKVVPSQIGYQAVDSCRNPCNLDFTEVFLLIKAIYPSSIRLWHLFIFAVYITS